MRKIKEKSAFILVGMPGSGKSTLAKKISKRINAHYLSSDEIRNKIFKSIRYDNQGDDAVNKIRKKVHSILFDQANKLLLKGEKVVIDATHLDPKTRSLAVQSLSKVVDKNKIYFVIVSTPHDEIDKRMQKRTEPHAKKSESLYEGWKRITSYFLRDFDSGKLKWPTKEEDIDYIESKDIEKHLNLNWHNKIKLLCWDLDGTLYPENLNLKKHIDDLIVNSIALKNNWTNKVAEQKIKQKVLEMKSTTKSLDYFGVDGTQFFINIWETIDLGLYIQKNKKLSKLFKESKIKNSIFTNSNTLNNVKAKLKIIGINPKDFSFIMTSTQIGFTKPDKKVFEAIIKKSGLKPSEILYVGDRDSVDILPAKKIGMKTCMVRNYSDRADICAKDPEEVLELFS